MTTSTGNKPKQLEVFPYQAFDDYQNWAMSKAVYDKGGYEDSLYPFFGIHSEVGELAAISKRSIRGDYNGKTVAEMKDMWKKELGDVLWYLAACAHECKLSLSEVVAESIKKLEGREQRGTLKGSGDDR